MYSFTVYQHKSTPAFRVVAGEHKPATDSTIYTVRVYQGSDREAAIHAAYSGETRKDIRAQIARFLAPEARVLSGRALTDTAAQAIPTTITTRDEFRAVCLRAATAAGWVVEFIADAKGIEAWFTDNGRDMAQAYMRTGEAAVGALELLINTEGR